MKIRVREIFLASTVHRLKSRQLQTRHIRIRYFLIFSDTLIVGPSPLHSLDMSIVDRSSAEISLANT